MWLVNFPIHQAQHAPNVPVEKDGVTRTSAVSTLTTILSTQLIVVLGWTCFAPVIEAGLYTLKISSLTDFNVRKIYFALVVVEKVNWKII